MAYYFMGDRSFIMIVGMQYGIFCCVLSAFCLNHTVQYFVQYIMNQSDIGIFGEPRRLDLEYWALFTRE
jgi:hypothetical protein